MKKVINFRLLLLLIPFIILSCKKNTEVTEITEEVNLAVPLVVQSDSAAFNVVCDLDSTALSKVFGNDLDKIKSLELLETKFLVTGYNNPIPNQSISASIYVSEKGGTTLFPIITFTYSDLASMVNHEFIFPSLPEGAEKFSELIKNQPHNPQVIFKGVVAVSYLLGVGFSGSAIFKFKQHKDNPT